MEKLDKFKGATARLVFDIIQLDGTIEDNEIHLLEGYVNNLSLPKDFAIESLVLADNKIINLLSVGGILGKYNIQVSNIQTAITLTTSDAITILKKWQEIEEPQNIKYNIHPIFRVENVIEDLKIISGCDGDRDISEAKFLAMVELCLDKSLSADIRGIPLKCRDSKVKFLKNEIIYLENNRQEHIHREINQNLDLIHSLLRLYAYEFVYIPEVVKFLQQKHKEGLLASILMFSNPFYYKDEKRARDFAEEIQSITTVKFAEFFLMSAYINKQLPSCLLIKFNTSKIHNNDTSYKEGALYSDFIAIPIKEGVITVVKRLLDKILSHTDVVRTLITVKHGNKLRSKGFHKTLIDYVVRHSSSNTLKKVVVNLREKRKYIDFVGIDGAKVEITPKEVSIYLTYILLSINGYILEKQRKKSFYGKDEVRQIFIKIYKLACNNDNALNELEREDIFKSWSVCKSKIRSKLKNIKDLDQDIYNIPIGKDNPMGINPQIIYICDFYCHSEVLITDWMRLRDIV